MAAPLLLLGLSWDVDRPSLAGWAEPPGGPTVELPLEPGSPFGLSVGGPRRCIGRDGSCPRGWTLPATGAGLCVVCRASTRALVTPGRTDAVAVDALRELKEIPHVVYLALFGANHVKMGVTAKQPPERRLIEQGASAGLFVAAADGVAARELERAAAAAGLSTAVRTTRKVHLLAERPTPAEAQGVLADALLRLRAAIPPGALIAEPTFVYLIDRYPGTLPSAGTHVVAPSHFLPGDRLAGSVRAVVGQVLLLADAAVGVMAVDTTRLQGYPGKLDPAATGPSLVQALAPVTDAVPAARRRARGAGPGRTGAS